MVRTRQLSSSFFLFFPQLVSRARPQTASSVSTRAQSGQKAVVLSLDALLESRDYLGAIAFIQHEKRSGRESARADLWLAFCYFHLGDFERAIQLYDVTSGDNRLNQSVCLFFSGQLESARALLSLVEESPLARRLDLHLGLRLNESLNLNETRLSSSVEDQLSLAAAHFARAHFQEAIDVYKKLLLENKSFIALHVYIATCYYKLDYYDVSQEVLSNYLTSFPESVVARNLKACNHFRLFDTKAAEHELRDLIDSISLLFFAKDLIKHNLVVFRNGESALQVLPSIVDIVPEARLNLCIHYLKNDQLTEAHALLEALPESQSCSELVLKGVCSVLIGQQKGQREALRHAQQCFQLVGQSSSECDTIQGRQSMSASFFIAKHFDDVILYLSSIKSYFYSDDVFAANFGQAKAATGHFREAEELFEQIQSERMREDMVLIGWRVRCYVFNKKPEKALVLVEKRENQSQKFQLLQLLANDCYRMGHFLIACRAFDSLFSLEANPEFWEGKRGSAAGVLQLAIAGKETKDSVSEAIRLLRNSNSLQSNQMLSVLRKWMKDSE